MRLGIIGINHKLANLKLRERLAQICQRRFQPNSSIHPDHHFVLLSTCNRTEVYFSSEDLTATHTYLLDILRGEVDEDFDQKLYTYFGKDCFRHLARVTAGLDSAILFETEIQGQVRSAYEMALSYHRLPQELHFLFQKVLRIGKQVRTDLPSVRGMPNLEHAVLQFGSGFFPFLDKARVLFIGASEINLKILHFLKQKGAHHITICNRTTSTAQGLANKHLLHILPWDNRDQWHTFDWVICGTKAPYPILRMHQLPSELNGRKLLIDLSVPRNIDPGLALHPQLSLYNVDQINLSLSNRRRALADRLACAEVIVDDRCALQISLFQQKEMERQRRLAIG